METVMELPSVGGLFFRILSSLLVIILLTYFVLKLIKKQNNLRFKQKGWIRVFDYQALGSNRGIYLMELLGSVYIVGASEGHLGIIKEIDPTDEKWLEVKEQLHKNDEIISNSLQNMITTGINRWKAKDITPTPAETPFSLQLDRQLTQQMERVNHLYRRAAKEEEKSE